MLMLVAPLAGLLLMMGHHARSESLFYYFRIEDQVPENHLLRLIDRHVSFQFVRDELRDSYSEAGRPSIDPEVLLRTLLLGYLYGITSERKLLEELRHAPGLRRLLTHDTRQFCSSKPLLILCRSSFPLKTLPITQSMPLKMHR